MHSKYVTHDINVLRLTVSRKPFVIQKDYIIQHQILIIMMNKVKVDKNITVSGNSLVIKVTKELKLMNLSAGEQVRVTLERI